MSSRSRVGRCCLCGEQKQLTREHIPPRKAFNDCSVLMHKMDREASNADGRLATNARVSQGGYKAPTLCADCNSRTGSWYGRAYVEFVEACAHYAVPQNSNRIVPVSLRVFPARVVKEALVIMCSSCGVDLTDQYPDLRQLLLSKSRRGLQRPLRLYAYVRCNPGGRMSGRAVLFHIGKRAARIVAEFSWWPLGLVLSFNEVPVEEAAEVTQWLNYEHDQSVFAEVSLPCRWATTPWPGDYRDPEQVAIETAANSAAPYH